MEDSLRACQDAGLKPAHILALQGPFSQEMNTAMLRSTDAKYLVTKEGGGPGGFDEKVRAARDAGAVLVVVGRPPQREGLDFSATVDRLCRRFGLTSRPQVALVGLGPGSRETLTNEAAAAIHQADCLIGARRMLDATAAPGQATYAAIAPQDIADFIKNNRQYRRFAVVLSGDVGFFSGAKGLLPLLSDCDVRCCPGLSSLVTLCARMGVGYEDVLPVSLHGRDRDIVPYVKAHRRVFALVGGSDGMTALCRRLTQAGLGEAKVTIGERLSYPDERLTSGKAKDLSDGEYQSLSVALVENPAAKAVVTHGLPDGAFLRGGDQKAVPMTKSEVRSVALSKLALTEDAVCWDVGAGTGSVAIEMALQAKLGRVYAIERRSDALELLAENARRLGAENLEVVSGTAPEVCRDLPAPTHVFLGGTAGNLREILTLLLEKNPHVRVVTTAIALESVAELTEAMKEFPFTETEAVSLTVARARAAGPYHLMTGQNPIYIFTLEG
jgi:precorrin-6Y C5,15-methyltransferase (decarboxylating)